MSSAITPQANSSNPPSTTQESHSGSRGKESELMNDTASPAVARMKTDRKMLKAIIFRRLLGIVGLGPRLPLEPSSRSCWTACDWLCGSAAGSTVIGRPKIAANRRTAVRRVASSGRDSRASQASGSSSKAGATWAGVSSVTRRDRLATIRRRRNCCSASSFRQSRAFR